MIARLISVAVFSVLACVIALLPLKARAQQQGTVGTFVLCGQLGQDNVCKGPVGSLVRFVRSSTGTCQELALTEATAVSGISCWPSQFGQAYGAGDESCWIAELQGAGGEPDEGVSMDWSKPGLAYQAFFWVLCCFAVFAGFRQGRVG